MPLLPSAGNHEIVDKRGKSCKAGVQRAPGKDIRHQEEENVMPTVSAGKITLFWLCTWLAEKTNTSSPLRPL